MKALQNALGRLGYLLLTVLMTALGVTAWLYSSLRDRTSSKPAASQRAAKLAPLPTAPPRERVPK